MRSHVKWLVALGCATATLLLVLHIASIWYLRRERQGYRDDIATIQRRSAAYRRPFVFGEAIDQNAAAAYRLALPHLSAALGNEKALRHAAGAEPNAGVAQDLLNTTCAAIPAETIQNALRSTRCDWERRFGWRDLDRTEETLDTGRAAYAVGECLVIAGHHAAVAGDRDKALRSYLEAISVGCDLGTGTDVMCAFGMVTAHDGLVGIGRLIMSAEDQTFLDELRRRIANVEGRLPDGRLAIDGDRVWLQNAVALNKLAEPGSQIANFVRIAPGQILAAWRLWRERAFFLEFKRLVRMTSRDEGAKRVEELTRRSPARSEITTVSDLPQAGRVALSTFDVLNTYRAVEAAIDLQKQWIQHHQFPNDAATFGELLGGDGLEYEVQGSGAGYKLVGPRGTILERTAR
jgi:hypothetical protein